MHTGVPGLDQLLGGGLPARANLLLYGEPLCGKKIMAMQYIYQGLVEETPGIFVLTDFGYLDWRVKMAALGMDLAPFEQSGLIQVIDCYSRQLEPALQDAGVVSYAASPAALSSISMHIARVQDELVKSFPQHRLAFHSLSSLLKETDSPTAFRFMQFVVGKFRREGATAMYLMEKGMHDEKDVKMVEHLMDGVIEFDAGKLRIKGMGMTADTWYHYYISDQGLMIRI
ncbi:MAG: RAD55 family ATPase [Candidatus Marsarchaeota archaeon]|nr:RAD55 family ATPase [Candidatus Marsarchaeota archaeon]